MRTTVDIDSTVLEELKERAREEDKTVSQLLTELALAGLAQKRKQQSSRPLRWHSQDMKPLIDIDDKEALWRVLDSGHDVSA